MDVDQEIHQKEDTYIEERSEVLLMDEVDDEMPGFRFRPTDEELVGYYLRRKVQQKSLRIDLIKQVDIYEFDPWDLPNMASGGEKEWYFYCPRYRKYRNSARPNRVTKSKTGFWKATGTDKSIYSSQGKCIGLKKSLVFYKGRAAKGKKTDWMMHEFRLPGTPESSSSKKFSDKSFPSTVSWAICKIFEKTSSLSMVQKALSQTWMSQLPTSMVSDLLTQGANWNQFSSELVGSSAIQFGGNNQGFTNANNTNNFSSASDNIPNYKLPVNSNTISKSSQIPVPDGDIADNLMFQTVLEATGPTKTLYDASSIFSNIHDNIGFEDPNHQFGAFSISLPQDIQGNQGPVQINQWETEGRTIGFPFNLSPNDAWRTNNVAWDSPPFSSEMPITYAISKLGLFTE